MLVGSGVPTRWFVPAGKRVGTARTERLRLRYGFEMRAFAHPTGVQLRAQIIKVL